MFDNIVLTDNEEYIRKWSSATFDRKMEINNRNAVSIFKAKKLIFPVMKTFEFTSNSLDGMSFWRPPVFCQNSVLFDLIDSLYNPSFQ